MHFKVKVMNLTAFLGLKKRNHFDVTEMFRAVMIADPPPSQVLEEAVSARFRSVSYLHTRGPGLAGHLSALQHAVMADLATVRHLLEHCVPPHYQLTAAYLKATHHCLHTHLTQVREGGCL